MIGDDYIDLRDVLDTLRDEDSDEDEREEARRIYSAFVADGLAQDEDDFESIVGDDPTAIHERHFGCYAEELAEDIGAVPSDLGWPLRHIDWSAAAAELEMDYSSFEVDGHRYLIRAY